MVLFPENGNNSKSVKINSSLSLKGKNSNNDNQKPSKLSILSKKGIELMKNIVMSAYDQRKLPFISKLKKGFSILNVFTIFKVIIYSYREGKSFIEITKDVAYECLKIFAGLTLCHITTSLMETLVDKLLKSGIKGIIVSVCGFIGFPPAPLLLFIFDILISWLGGKIVDLIRYFYVKYLKVYVDRAFNWVKEKAKSAWNWFTGLFK